MKKIRNVKFYQAVTVPGMRGVVQSFQPDEFYSDATNRKDTTAEANDLGVLLKNKEGETLVPYANVAYVHWIIVPGSEPVKKTKSEKSE
jgi:hypothetical protein